MNKIEVTGVSEAIDPVARGDHITYRAHSIGGLAGLNGREVQVRLDRAELSRLLGSIPALEMVDNTVFDAFLVINRFLNGETA